MNAKHTGGPWQSQHDFDLSGEYTIIGNVDGEIIDGHTHYSYTLICEVYDNENREEDAANARLITEAPAMLKVLRELSYWFNADPEVLAAMSADERADHERQRGKIDAILARIDRGKS